MKPGLIRDSIRRYGDAMLGLALGGLLAVEYATDGDLSAIQVVAGCGVATLIGFLVAVRTRAPIALLAITMLVVSGRALLPAGGDGVAWGIVAMLAFYTAAAHTSGWREGVGAVLAATTALVIMAYDGGNWNLGGVLFYGLLVGAPWLFGRTIRHRRERERLLADRADILERTGEMEKRRAVEEERARIARELHDVVGHALGVIVVQADGGRRLLPTEPGQTERALETIERTGREALGEMRRLVAMLRVSDEQLALLPQPGLGQLEALADQVRGAGVPVDVVVEGEPRPLPPGIDLSAYRIAQEALTNVLKHAGPAHARVVVNYGASEVGLEIVDDGIGRRPRPSEGNGGGHGLIGIRERVAMFDGSVDAGPRDGGGFVVSARLPYGASG